MNLTLAVDDQVVRRARAVAEAMGKSLNQVVREHLESLAAADDAEAQLAELRRLSEASGGSRGTGRFDRDNLHARSQFADTNVLVYTDDSDDAAKREATLVLIERLRRERAGVIRYPPDEPPLSTFTQCVE